MFHQILSDLSSCGPILKWHPCHSAIADKTHPPTTAMSYRTGIHILCNAWLPAEAMSGVSHPMLLIKTRQIVTSGNCRPYNGDHV